jgi:hypothetical protein
MILSPFVSPLNPAVIVSDRAFDIPKNPLREFDRGDSEVHNLVAGIVAGDVRERAGQAAGF